MPITPGTLGPSSYHVGFTIDGVQFIAQANTPIYDEGDADTATQKLVDALDTMPDATFDWANKGRAQTDSFTPTP